MIRASIALVTCLAAAVSCPGSAADGGARATLAREETVALFAGLAEAAKSARTFQARLRRSERTGFVLDERPLVSEGRVWIERPDRFCQEISRPHRGLTVANGNDLWVYFPESREVQHIDLRKGLKGRSETTSDAFMPWLAFDLQELEKKYRVAASACEAPAGVTIRRPPGAGEGRGASAGPPRSCFRIDFAPRDAKFAPGLARLSIWVEAGTPWPLKIERESVEGELMVSEFAEIVLDAPVEASRFQFRPPAGTKRVELSD